ncbi:ferrous iron transport protein A [Lutibacter sp. B2]|nr:ferrous iron transport protein A [Lutibacter sp. B2]
MVPLNTIGSGEIVYIKSLNGGKKFIQRVSDLGFTIDAEIRVVENSFCGPIMVVVKESKIGLGPGEASKIIVYQK